MNISIEMSISSNIGTKLHHVRLDAVPNMAKNIMLDAYLIL